ncbi:MAG TPA: hypothetical protein VNP95_06920 [Thermomicrobiales bacterium]|nr:hypothetical protein [Thermomicrobiales bacterium]
MNDPWDIAQDRQQNVEPELSAQTDGEEDADRREQDGEQDAKKVCHGTDGARWDRGVNGTVAVPFQRASLVT